MSVDYSYLPAHMQEGARRYVEDGIRPGDFLLAILKNDFAHAWEIADEINRDELATWAKWLNTECPVEMWGTHLAVEWRLDGRSVAVLAERHAALSEGVNASVKSFPALAGAFGKPEMEA